MCHPSQYVASESNKAPLPNKTSESWRGIRVYARRPVNMTRMPASARRAAVPLACGVALPSPARGPLRTAQSPSDSRAAAR